MVRNYTHFWATKRNLDRAEWDSLANAASKIAKVCEDFASFSVRRGMQNPHIKIDSIVPFEYSLFELVPSPVSFVHCRTNHDVFDLPVTMMLLVAKRKLPEWIKLTSDGTWEEWADARAWCREVFSYKDDDFAAAKQDFDELLDKEDR